MGVPGAKKEEKDEEEQINVVCFVLMIINELLRLHLCVKCVPTLRIMYVRIRYTFRMIANWQCVGSLVQCALDL